jgi:hypothetical protein
VKIQVIVCRSPNWLAPAQTRTFLSKYARALKAEVGVDLATQMKNPMLTHIVSVSALQTTEDDRRRDGQYAQRDESLVNSANHFGWIGVSGLIQANSTEIC